MIVNSSMSNGQDTVLSFKVIDNSSVLVSFNAPSNVDGGTIALLLKNLNEGALLTNILQAIRLWGVTNNNDTIIKQIIQCSEETLAKQNIPMLDPEIVIPRLATIYERKPQ